MGNPGNRGFRGGAWGARGSRGGRYDADVGILLNRTIRAAWWVGVLLMGMGWALETFAQAPRRPNIIVILADDLGYSDLGCYGGEIRTPHLDALAAKGLRFTQFYNGARCCPTRASLMTGLYPHQAGVGRMTRDEGAPGYRGTLGPNSATIAELLGAAGYRTGMAGKWHLSLTEERPGHMAALNNQRILDTFADPATYPVGRGFAEHYGIIWGVVNFFDPFSLVRNAEAVREVPKDYYITDALGAYAVDFVARQNDAAEPFFLYLAYTAPHWPLHAREEDVARYAETYAGGWDAVRAARHARMMGMGLLSREQKTLSPPIERKTAWENNPTKEWDARAMAVHATMIDSMDRGIGQVVAKLAETKQLDNTLILFLSDNGASPEAYPNPGFDRPSETRDGRKIVYPPNKTTMPGPETTFFGFGPAWANVANTPLRWWKAEVHEGGICTPMIAHWPAGMGGKGGAITHQVGHVMDIMATCLDVAGVEYPRAFAGRELTPIEGKSLAPVLRGGRREGHAAIGWEHYDARALRMGDWKLVARAGKPWELYDLSRDRVELNDLAGSEPERVREMGVEWEKWARRTWVLPKPGRR